MGKIKKIRAEFKEQNLLSKFRIIFISILMTVVVVFIGFWAIYFACDWGKNISKHYSVKMTQPISSKYCVCTYEDGSCQLVVTESQKKIGSRFTSIVNSDAIGDSVIFLYNDKGWKTFSLKTGNFSEEYFDNIGKPDTIHHYAACSQQGLLGFLDVHNGTLAIPLKFCAMGDFTPNNGWEFPCERDLQHLESASEANEEIGVVSEPAVCEQNEQLIEEEWDVEKIREEVAKMKREAQIDRGRNETTETYYLDYKYPKCHIKESYDGTIQFTGDFCIVPTTTTTYGVIDITGKILFDGYERIIYYPDYKLFKAYKNKKCDLFTEDLTCIASRSKGIIVLPQGIYFSNKGILTDHTGTNTLTNLVIRGYGPDIEEFGYSEYDYDYYCRDYHTVAVLSDVDEDDIFTYYCDTKYGIIKTNSAHIVIEPLWDSIRIYKNNKGDYVFLCKIGNCCFLLDKNGEYLSRKRS